jgi:hypothetical protein
MEYPILKKFSVFFIAILFLNTLEIAYANTQSYSLWGNSNFTGKNYLFKEKDSKPAISRETAELLERYSKPELIIHCDNEGYKNTINNNYNPINQNDKPEKQFVKNPLTNF